MFLRYLLYISLLASPCMYYADEPIEFSTEQSISHPTTPGDFFTRVRALYIWPNDSSGPLNAIPDSGVSIHPCWTGEFDIGYMFSKNLALALMLTTCQNTIVGTGLLGGIDIGTTWLFPPALTLQWCFFYHDWLQPYLGLGANYTLFYGSHCSITETHMKLRHSWGPVAQGGLDIFFYKNWLFNLDVKYMAVSTDILLNGLLSGKVHLRVDPWIFGAGIGCEW
ncbi:MAG: OmpW family outer membrane protein [Chlamydiales bacterium]|nr:OmpW family outer membrane protein [Chlamydiales bacterium]